MQIKWGKFTLLLFKSIWHFLVPLTIPFILLCIALHISFLFLPQMCLLRFLSKSGNTGSQLLAGSGGQVQNSFLSSEACIQQYPSEVPCVPQVVTSSRSVSVKEIVFPLIIFTKLFIYSILWSSSSLIARLTSPLTASNGTMLWLMSYFRLTTLKSTLSGEKILCTATVNHKEHISSDLIRRIFSHSY